MRRLLLVLFITVLSCSVYSQSTWRGARHELVMGVGGNIFMGDLGGGYKNGTHIFAIDDVDPNFMKFSGMFGYKYRFTERLYGRINVVYSEVGADDAKSKSDSRISRNLNFRSRLLDIGATMDYYFLKEKTIVRFDDTPFWRKCAGYFFVGFGALKYNPKGKYQGQWYDLQPLCTEGQGSGVRFLSQSTGTVVQAGEPYKLLAAAIPIGVGFKCQLSRELSVGIEFAQRFTTTDYIDDCSSYYFNYDEMGVNPPSEMTKYLSDKSGGVSKTGTVRGNSGYNDSYFTGMITFYYKFSSSNGQ